MPKQLRINIADITFGLSIPCRRTFNFLGHYFRDYTTTIPPHYTIIVDTFAPPVDVSIPVPVIPEVDTLPDSRTVLINSRAHQRILGTINNDKGEVILNGYACSGEYPLTAVIRVAVQYFIECNGGFFLHSACGVNHNMAVAFTGKSTAGKTTALNNLHPDKVISEDAAAVRYVDSEWTVFATPFRGEKPARARLSTLCFPRRWKGIPFLNLSSPAEVVTELSTNAMFAAPSCEEHMNRVLETMIMCGSQIPGFDCYFYKTTNLQTVFSDHGLLN
jgi:hypothetical protein